MGGRFEGENKMHIWCRQDNFSDSKSTSSGGSMLQSNYTIAVSGRIQPKDARVNMFYFMLRYEWISSNEVRFKFVSSIA